MDIQIIQQYIEEHQLLNRGDKVIVGVSGGADSVALLDILYWLGYECVLAHCNFHLRGEESNRDANYVQELCKQYKLDYNSIDFDTEAYATENKISIEMAARKLRYTWFEEQRKKHKAVAIAVAHHMDDSVETVLLNLIRGTGIRGVTGISARNEHVIRPLLAITRQQIEDYLATKNIGFVDDSTNAEDIYTRNKIRLNILPLLETINPSVKYSINKTAKHLQQVQHIYLNYIEEASKAIFINNRIHIDTLFDYIEPEAILYEIVAAYNFTGAVVHDLYLSLKGESGRIFYSSTHKALKDREFVIISDLQETSEKEYLIKKETTALSHPLALTIEYVSNAPDFRFDSDSRFLYVDADKLKFPLILRRWQQGDWFIPFGMKGRKKISDYFTDNKFNLFDKENTWLLCSNDHIVWIIGHRSDDRYKVSPSTSRILKIEAKC